MLRLQQVDLQCSSCLSTKRPNTHLQEENLNAYVVLLSAHFQGFCRDLYTEAALVISSRMRSTLRPLVQEQFTIQRKLDRGNPTHDNLKEDFKRLGFTLDLAAEPAN